MGGGGGSSHLPNPHRLPFHSLTFPPFIRGLGAGRRNGLVKNISDDSLGSVAAFGLDHYHPEHIGACMYWIAKAETKNRGQMSRKIGEE